jgi:hypothetical protein
MRVARILMMLALVPSLADAQVLKTHGAPDRSVYNSRAEWPTDSFQCHWAAIGASGHSDMRDTLGFNPTGQLGMPAHIHLHLTHPRYAEISSTWVVDFIILAFHFDGVVYGPWAAVFKSPQVAHDWWFDDTQSSTPPAMNGDPIGIRQWTGHFSIDPRVGSKGWDIIEMAVEAHFTNKDVMDVEALESYYNLSNPDLPETPAGPFMGTICSPFVFNDESVFGSNEMFVDDFLPTAPVNGKWETTTEIEPYRTQVGSPTAFTNSYGGSSLLSTIGSYQTRHDQDFHNGKPGVIVSEVDSTGIIPGAIKIDNSGLPVGAHPWAMIRFQPEKLNPQNGVASLLVIQVPNTTAVAPPPPPPSVPPLPSVPPPSSSPPPQELPTIPTLNQ